MNQRDFQILKCKNRIATLESRTGRANSNIIRKIQRQLRMLEQE